MIRVGMENRKERLQAIPMRTLACFSVQRKEKEAWTPGNFLWGTLELY
jgi:hypothetical protein